VHTKISDKVFIENTLADLGATVEAKYLIEDCNVTPGLHVLVIDEVNTRQGDVDTAIFMGLTVVDIAW